MRRDEPARFDRAQACLLGLARERLRGGNRGADIAAIARVVAGVGRKRAFEPDNGFIVPSEKQQRVAHCTVPAADIGERVG